MNPVTNRGRSSLLYLFFYLILLSVPATAQQGTDSDQAASAPLSEAFYSDLKLHERQADELKSLLNTVDGMKKDVLQIRIKASNRKLAEHIIKELNNIPADERPTYTQTDENRQAMLALFATLSNALQNVNTLIFEEIKNHEENLPPAEQAIADSKIQLVWKELELNQSETLSALKLAAEFTIDISNQRDRFRQRLINQAETLSAGLTLSLKQIDALRKSQAVIPANEDIKAKLSVAENRAAIFSQQLSAIMAISNQMDIDTSRYNQQVILATGQISSNIFDTKVIAGLLDRAIDSALSSIADKGPSIVFNLLLFLLIIYLASRLSKLAKKVVSKGLASAKVPLSNLLQKMVVSVVGNGILFLGALIALSQIGVSLGPVLAGLGVAGFVIGFALQDSMSNFASGLLILIYRPFDIDDVIEAGGVLGKVKKMSLVNTTVHSLDNQTFVIPNNSIWQSTIKNLTEQKIRRVDLVFGISYNDDIPKTEQVLKDILKLDERVLDSPEPVVKVHELGDSSVNFIVRPWVNTEDYWETYWNITKTVKMRFDEEGISIPFPQRDVHMFQQAT